MKNHTEIAQIIALLLTANKPYRTLRIPEYSTDARIEHVAFRNILITIWLHVTANEKGKIENSN